MTAFEARSIQFFISFCLLGRWRVGVVATRPRLPHSEPAKEGIGVAAQPAALPSPAAEGRLLQRLGVPSADDDVIEEKRGREPFHPERDGLAPFLLPELLEPASS